MTYDSSSKYDPSRELLIKQTYTVFVETDKGPRKWHLSQSLIFFYLPCVR